MSQQEQVVKWPSWLQQEQGVGHWSVGLGCRALCWEPLQPDVRANTSRKELPTQRCSSTDSPLVELERVTTFAILVGVFQLLTDVFTFSGRVQVVFCNKHILTS